MSQAFLSNRILKLKPSATLALAAKALELKQQGKDVISLSLGEPDWPSFKKMTEAAKQALDDNKTKYTPASGIKSLKQEIIKDFNQSFGLNLNEQNVSVTGGAKFCIFAAMQATLNPGDEVIIPAPYWVSYPSMAELCEAKSVIVNCDAKSNFKLTPKLLETSISAKSKILILNSPSNPTGIAYSADELKALADVLRKHPQILILSDDIYNRLVFTDKAIAPHILEVAPDLLSRCLSINGVSKTYSMTGWRLGWTIGPKVIVDAMTNYQSQSLSCASSFVQEAVAKELNNCVSELKDVNQKLFARMQKSLSLIRSVPDLQIAEPNGAFYFWVDINHYLNKTYNNKQIKTSSDFCLFLLEDYSVACVPGIEFGLDGYMRISYVVSEQEFSNAVDRIKSFVQKIS